MEQHPRPRRPRRWLLAALMVMVLSLVGCVEDEPEATVDEVTVTGAFGSVPTVAFDAPLPLRESTIETLIAGDGRELAADEPVLFMMTAYDGHDGELLAERGAGAVRTLMLTPEDVGEDLFPILSGTAEGSRLLVQQPVTEDDVDRMLVLVIDVLHTRAHGTEVEPGEEALPEVELSPDGAPTITVPEGEPPRELVIAPRVRGEGEQVRPGQDVTVQYTGVEWAGGELYDSTWESGKVPQTVAIDDTFPGLRAGLVDQTVGSQVLLVVPPALAVGTETLVMVVDILATSGDDGSVVVPSAGTDEDEGATAG